MVPPQFRIGCAGWAIPRQHASSFSAAGSHLARYARRFNAVEINSSFYRPHRFATYVRWAAAVPDDFAFAAKLPKQITHELRLAATEAALEAFFGQISGLGSKLGPLLVQLPPSLRFDRPTVESFFAALRTRFRGSVVCEPRHASWFNAEAEAVLMDFQVARAAADPPVAGATLDPGGWQGLHYFRLHGSPRVYYSSYGTALLQRLARQLDCRSAGAPSWCIFDNTALGAATVDAFALQEFTGKISQP
jgi:uncharacterized protein YecE (DUF72 family)